MTHWLYCAELARRYPAINVESDPIFVRDNSVWTSAGVTAGIDLALALVGQSQFSEALSLQAAEDKFGASQLPSLIERHTTRL